MAVVVTAVSVDAALSLVGFYGGLGDDDVDLQCLPPGDLARATLQLALLVRRCLGKTDDERVAELERIERTLSKMPRDYQLGQRQMAGA